MLKRKRLGLFILPGIIAVALAFVTYLFSLQPKNIEGETEHRQDIDANIQYDRASFTVGEANGRQILLMDVNDFIDVFNINYELSYGIEYIKDFKYWDRLSKTEDKGIPYRFTASDTRYTQPSMTVYISEEAESIYEILLTFDHHGYQESLYKEYYKMCLCAFLTLIPQADINEVEELFTALYNEALYGTSVEGKISDIVKRGDFIFSSYYGAGTVNIIILPSA